MDPVVRVEGLHVVRGGGDVLEGLDLHLGPGVTGLLGPSGSGKTTLLRCLVGAQQVRAGTVTVLGEPAGSPALRRRVGYVTQAPSVYGDLTVTENLRFFARVLDVDRSRVTEVLETVDLTEQAERTVDRLSGGQRSRVSLAVALLAAPDLLVLDEPTVGLDPLLRTQLWARFHALAAAGVAVLVSSHAMDEAERCDDLVLLREGRVVGRGSPAELRRRTGTTDVEQAFVALVEGDR